MSQEVEQRIVEMRFDNKNFEKNAAATMKTLDEFESKLNFKNAGKGIEELNKAGQKFSLHPMTDAAEAVEVKFSAMSIAAISAIQRIVDKGMDAGERLIKSLSVDQVTAGWDKYAQKTSAVQTIMAATAKQYDNTEQQMADVNEQLEKLNWFTDETSYSFLDMVSNIGKFTSNQIGLEDSVTAMQGISTWAAISGANVNEAGRAMYNLSQALGTGAVKLIDWKSIENANMATAEFKQTVLDTAVALGKVKETGDGVYETLAGNEVSVSNFNENLKDAWFDKEVLMTVLEQYGMFADKLYEVQNETDLTATQLLQAVDAYKAGTLDLSDILKDTEVPAERLTELIGELSDDVYDLGWRSFRAAQEAKTFKEAIDSVKDAVSTGWMNTFEIIFGDYEQARKLWTNVANELYDVFAESGNTRNEILKEWASAENGGRDMLFEAASNTWRGFRAVIDAVGEAIRDVFPPITAERLVEFTRKLRDLTEQYQLSEKAMDGFKRLLKGVLSPLKLVGKGAKTAGKWLGKLAEYLFKGANSLLEFIADIDPLPDLLKKVFGEERYERGAKALQTIGENLSKAFSVLRDGVDALIPKSDRFSGILDSARQTMRKFGDSLSDHVVKGLEKVAKIDFEKGAQTVVSALERIVTYIQTHSLKDVANDIKKWVDNIKRNLSGVLDGTAFSGAWQWLRDGWDELMEKLGVNDDDNVLSRIINDIRAALENATPLIDSFKTSIKNMVSEITPAKALVVAFGIGLTTTLFSITNSLATFRETTQKIGTFFSTLTKKIAPKYSVFKDVAVAIGTLALALVVLSRVDPAGLERAKGALWTMTAVLGILAGGSGILGKFVLKKGGIKQLAEMITSLKGLALAVLTLAAALKVLSTVDVEGLLPKIGALGLVMLEFAVTAIAITRLGKGMKGFSLQNTGLLGIAGSILLLVLAIKKLADVDFGSADALIKKLFALQMAVLMMAELAKYVGNVSFGNAVGMILLAGNLLWLVKVMKKLAKEPIDQIIAGFPQYLVLLTAMAGLAGVMRLAGEHSKGAGLAVAAIAVSMEILIHCVKKLGELDPDALKRGATATGLLLIVLGGIVAATKFAGANALRAGGAVLMLAGALDLMLPAIKVLGSMSTRDVVRGGTAVAALMLVFGYVVKMTSLGPGVKSGIASIVALTVAIGLITFAIGLLSMLSSEDVLTAAGALSVCVLALGGAVRLIQGTDWRKSIPSVIAMGVILAEALIALAILDGFNGENLIKGAESLTMVLGTVGALFAVFSGLTKFGVDPKKVATMALGFDAVAGLIVALVGVVGALASIDAVDNALDKGVSVLTKLTDGGMLQALASFVGLFGVFAAAGKFEIKAGETMKMAATFDAVVLIVTSLVAALGAIFDALEPYGGIEWLDRGIIVMQKIGDAIGGFVGNVIGSLIGGIGEGISSTLPGMAENLSDFSEKIKPFFENVASINDDAASGVKNLSKSLLYLTEASFVDGIMRLLGLGDLSTFGASLSGLGKGLGAYSASIQGLAYEDIEKSAEAIGLLAKIQNDLDPAGGVWGTLSGNQTLGQFSQGLVIFGQALADYSEAVDGVNVGSIQVSAKAAAALVELQNSMDNAGGIFGMFTGNQTIGAFGVNIVAFGKAIKLYGDEVDGINTSAISTSVYAARQLVDIQNSMENAGGIFGAFTGNQALGGFGQNVRVLGNGLRMYSESISGIEFTNFGPATKAILSLVELQDSLGTTGGFAGWLFGGKDTLGSFGSNLKKLGKGLSDYASTVANVGWENIDVSLEYISKIVNATHEIAGVDVKAANSFKQATETLGNTGFTGFIDGIKSGADKAIGTGKQLIAWVTGGAEKELPTMTDTGAAGSEALISGLLSGEAAQTQAGHDTIDSVVSGAELALPLVNGAGVDTYKELVAGVLSDPNALKKAGETAVGDVETGASNNSNALYSVGQNVVQGFINGINKAKDKLSGIGASLGNLVKGGAQKSLDEHSPSKEFYKIGEYVVWGFNLGLIENMKSLEKSAGILGNTAIGEVLGIVSELSNVETDMSISPTIKPVLDLSELQSGVYAADNMLLGFGSMDFVNQANVAMQMKPATNQNGALLDAVTRLDKQMSAVEATVNRFQRFADTSLGQVVGGAVVQALDGVSMNANGREIGKLAAAYQSGMQRRGGY